MTFRTPPTELTLNNGLKIIVLENPQATGVTCLVNYKVSRRNESVNNAGINFALISALREDNDDRTPKQYPKLTVNTTYTTFRHSINPDQLGRCFELNARMMSTPILTENTLERVIRFHLELRKDQRQFTSEDSIPVEFDSLCHPIGYRYMPIATPESAARIDIGQLQQWHQHYYSPGNACLIIAGNVKAAEAVDLARQHFDPIPVRSLAPVQEVQQLCELDKRHFVLRKATPKPRLLVAFNLPGMKDAAEDKSGGAQRILCELLGQKLAARLPVSSGTCIYEEEKYASLFRISVTANTRDQSLKELEADLEELIDELKFNAPSPNELEAARERALANLADSEDHKAWAIAIGELEDSQIPFGYLDQRYTDLLNVTAEDMQRTAKTFFTPQRTTVAHILPIQPATRTMPLELTLDNGLKIIVVENPRAEKTVCVLNYKVSSRNESAENSGINNLLNTILSEDNNFSGAVPFNIWQLNDLTQYSLITHPANLEGQFEIFARTMSAPVLTERTMKTEVETKLENGGNNQFFISDYSPPAKFNELTYPASGYGKTSITPESAANIDLNQIQQWHDHYYSPGNACLVVIGNVKAQEIETLAQEYFGAVPFRPAAPGKEVQELSSPGERRITLHMDTETPRLLVAFNMPGMVDGVADKSAAALQIISLYFEQNYAAYLPASHGHCAYTQHKYAGLLTFSVTATQVVQPLEVLETALIEMIDQLKSNGAIPEKLESAREQALVRLGQREGNDTTLAYDLSLLENNQLPLTYLGQRHVDLREVTADDIRRVASNCFTSQRMTVAHVLPMPPTQH